MYEKMTLIRILFQFIQRKYFTLGANGCAINKILSSMPDM